MDVKTKISESQQQVIDKLALYEASIADLYEAYSGALPDMADFWLALSCEERSHAQMLKSLQGMLDKGNLFYNLGRFDTISISSRIADIQAEIAIAKQGEVTQSHALRTALCIEKSIMDSKFYAEVYSDAPEFSVIASHLSKSTERHCQLVQEQFTNHGTTWM